MKKIGRLIIIISACAPFIAGCGLTGSSTQLPQLDRNTLAAVYNPKQKDAAIKSMSDLASKQKAEADKVLEPDTARPVTAISVSN